MGNKWGNNNLTLKCNNLSVKYFFVANKNVKMIILQDGNCSCHNVYEITYMLFEGLFFLSLASKKYLRYIIKNEKQFLQI